MEYISHRQKKHASALLKSQRRVKKYSKDKDVDKIRTKQYRKQERQEKTDMSETRLYYCNRCKVWNSTGECGGCYYESWCGVDCGVYTACLYGVDDLCPYHVDDFVSDYYDYL